MMEHSDDEILAAADRIRARRGLRLVKTCAQCGAVFAGVASQPFCSDACGRAATMGENASPPAPVEAMTIEIPKPDESKRAFVARKRMEKVARGELTTEQAAITEEVERRFAASEELSRFRRATSALWPTDLDSTELIRQERDQRTYELASALGGEK